MARAGITFEQVAAVADAMVGAGQAPTINGVRDTLGTGSPNTVHKHLTAWRAARPQAVAAAVELPAELVNALGAEITRAAAKARGEIEGALVQAQAEASELATVGEALEGADDGELFLEYRQSESVSLDDGRIRSARCCGARRCLRGGRAPQYLAERIRPCIGKKVVVHVSAPRSG